MSMVQWNFTRNGSNVFRGMHVHPSHTDYLVQLEGQMALGLMDVRKHSRTFEARATIHISEASPVAVIIPPGVLHGYFVPKGNLMVIGMSEGWSMQQEFGCRWDDPAIALEWPDCEKPELSPRDQDAMTFEEMLSVYRAATDRPASIKMSVDSFARLARRTGCREK
jgi:dTDP-4-dehydrorhamnose 3,5-epimerase